MDQFDLFGNKIDGSAKSEKKTPAAPKEKVKKAVKKGETLEEKTITKKVETVVDKEPTVVSKDKVDETTLTKVYYTISEVAKMFDVNASLLRFWEKEFKQLGKIKKNKKGDRYYNKHNIRHLNIIYYLLKEQKMTIAGARNMIKNKQKSTIAQFDIVENLQKVRGFLVDLKTSFQ